MPKKKMKFEEIRKGVVWEIEGMSAIEIAIALTADNFKALDANGILPRKSVEKLLTLNTERVEKDNISRMMAKIIAQVEIPKSAKNAVELAIVHPKRIRTLMKSEMWVSFRESIKEEHIKLLAKEEAGATLFQEKYQQSSEGSQVSLRHLTVLCKYA